MKRLKSQNAFTLIELLIVIAIGMILTAVIIGSISDSRTRAQDSKKIAEMRDLQIALALYFDKHKVYPSTGTWVADLKSPDALVPADFNAITPTQFFYEVPTGLGTDGRYCLGVHLEATSLPAGGSACSVSGANYTAQPRLGF